MAELYRTKDGPTLVEVEVNQLLSTNGETVALWCGGVLVTEHDALQHDITFVGINVPTAFGMKRAQEDDWIVRRPAGDFIVIGPVRFENLFEAVVDG